MSLKDQGESLAEVRQILLQHGGWLGGYVPENAVVAVGTPKALSAVGALDHVLLASLLLPPSISSLEMR